MQLNPLIAKQIVERAKKILHCSINVMDENGVIIGSSDTSRLHQTHEGALLVIHDNRTIEIDDSVASTLAGVKQGINLPILYADNVVGVVGLSGAPAEVRKYGELVKMTAELIVEQAAMMSQIQWSKRHREELLLQLIQGSELNENQLLSIAQQLDLNLVRPRVAAIIKIIPKPNDTVTLEHLQKLVHLLEHPERDNIVGIVSVSLNEVVVLQPVTLVDNTYDHYQERKRAQKLLRRIKAACHSSTQIAIGEHFSGLSGLTKSYQTARATLDANRSLDTPILFYQEHKLSVLISAVRNDPWSRAQLTAPLDKLVKADTKEVLLKTLSVFFEQNCDLSQTCDRLHIHRNTLRYRLEQIENKTELNINKLDEKVQLYLALKCLL
ncbi:helix-turn-helix domain-containing protein [Vibrio sp. ZSDZ34]|jgi:carbohydrate diacid regulator|uniref:Helix-turn-helix domain-containing protein n=1 Tax=Vibrio gelatinilyticus TaxID=2893468 RepID=A0A9X2B0D5_9VIBR|nr:sugar diacid recognition domain-containing protein [Vibrio gelatinilyticus]MCJ2378702.1 helix-turn-helix domain-containing protein [Vibrio gelatinilyticus]